MMIMILLGTFVGLWDAMSGNAMRSTRSKRSHNIFLCRSMSSKSFTTVWWHVLQARNPRPDHNWFPSAVNGACGKPSFTPRSDVPGCNLIDRGLRGKPQAWPKTSPVRGDLDDLVLVVQAWGQSCILEQLDRGQCGQYHHCLTEQNWIGKVMANIAPRHNLEVWQNGTLVPCCSTTIYSMWNIFHPYGFPLPWQKCSWSSAFGTCWELPILSCSLFQCRHAITSSIAHLGKNTGRHVRSLGGIMKPTNHTVPVSTRTLSYPVVIQHSY